MAFYQSLCVVHHAGIFTQDNELHRQPKFSCVPLSHYWGCGSFTTRQTMPPLRIHLQHKSHLQDLILFRHSVRCADQEGNWLVPPVDRVLNSPLSISCTPQCSWPKIWDHALDNGAPSTSCTQALLRLLTKPPSLFWQCLGCSSPVNCESISAHFLAEHTSLDIIALAKKNCYAYCSEERTVCQWLLKRWCIQSTQWVWKRCRRSSYTCSKNSDHVILP